MLERIMLAAVITFCVYLSLNLGSKPSNAPTFDSHNHTVPSVWQGVASFNL